MKAFVTNKKYAYFLTGVLVFLGIYLTSHYNYLLFHSLAEVFSIVIACGIFMVAWNSRQFLDNNYLLFLGGGSTLHFLSKRNTMDIQIYLV